MDAQKFISLVAPGAQSGQRKYGVLASLSIAQAILESGWGTHSPGNNLFGIKANGYDGATQRLLTSEVINGRKTYIYDTFRAYASLADSISDHGAFLAANRRYANIIGKTDYKTVCKLLQADGYATEPNYAQELIHLIERYGLNRYDLIPLVHIDAPKQGAAVKGAFMVGGWALGVTRVDVYADISLPHKQGLASIRNFSPRSDVTKAYPQYPTGGHGYTITVPVGKLAPGKHTIDVAGIVQGGGVVWQHINIVVR